MTSKLKPEQLVKELSKKKSNKNCFDCGRSGPQQNVNTTLNTFVCTQCAGIHRKFNHKVKTINMSTFTPSEVDALENGGNKRARKIWLATFDELKSYQLDPEDPNNIDRFMQLVYVDKKWAKPANAPVEEEDKKPKKKRKDSNVPDAFETTFPASVAITSTPAAAASKSAPQQSTPPKSQPTVDLGIDFLSNLTISTPAPAQQPASASTSQPFQSNDFGSNGLFDAPTATSNGTTSDPVDEFVAFFKRQQQQHNVSPSTVAGWVQKALATFSNGRAAAASSSFDASTANSAASNSQAAFQPQQQPQHQDAFADIDIPGEEDGDTGNPFDSSDDEDEPQPNGNYNAPITPALNQNFQQQQFNAHQQAQAQAQAQAQMQYQQMMYQQQMLAAQQQQMGSFGVPNGGFVPQQGYSPMNAFGQQSHQHPPTSQPPQFTVSQAQPNTQQPEHPPKPDLFAGLGGIGAF